VALPPCDPDAPLWPQDRLSQPELDAARDYDQLLQEYMDDVGEDLCKNMQPPKSVRIAVKVKEDFGECAVLRDSLQHLCPIMVRVSFLVSAFSGPFLLTGWGEQVS
jgi:hypothetical protein